MSNARGTNREQTLDRKVYFSDQYFAMSQLASFAHQLNYIHFMRPKSVIEIGIGNGFVSSFLRRSGIPVITADINPALMPDIVAPLAEVKSRLIEPQDLVVCCEVLEHMPLDELDANLDHLKSFGNRLFLTLPSARKTFGFSLFSRLPKFGTKMIDLNIGTPFKRNLSDSSHFWEVDFNDLCSRDSIVSRLRQRYSSVRFGRFSLNPCHVWFVCE